MKKLVINILRLILLLSILPVSYLVKRDKRLWVFGTRDGFIDNSKYFYLWVNEYSKDIRAVWISKSKDVCEELRGKGYEAYTMGSIMGLWCCFRAKVYVFTHSLMDINGYTFGRSIKVNFWHGVGLKNLGYKNDTGPNSKYYKESYYKLIYPYLYIKPDVFLTTSELMTRHFMDCFRIERKNIYESILPRLDIDNYERLRSCAEGFGDYNEIRKEFSSFSQVYLYMPTFRELQEEGINKGIPNLERLNACLKLSNSVLYIKAHINERFTLSDEWSNIKLWPSRLDIYLILSEIDCLITDYSSILYDSLLSGIKGIILYTYDYDQYISQQRDLAMPFDENVVGVRVNSFEEFCKVLSEGVVRIDGNPSHLIEKFWSNAVPGGSRDIFDKVSELAGINEVPSNVGANPNLTKTDTNSISK